MPVLRFDQVSQDRFDARFPVDWVLGFRACRPQTRSFAVIRRTERGWLLYIHDRGPERLPVVFDDKADAEQAATLVAETPPREFARLRTILGQHMARNFGLAHPAAQKLAQDMRSAMVARYALRHSLARTARDRSTLRVIPRVPPVACCR
ncbi:MAG: hypothetical protein J2P17_19900 [Mycobacterium sp.]|nr:hypothetical protein [Mycobacterium sp.]